MRRFALMLVIAVTVPAAARAQACLGSVSFASVPVRLGGGAILGKDYTAYAISLIAGKENSAFGDVGASRMYFDDADDTGDNLFAQLGYQIPAGSRAQLCPIVGASIGTGPDDGAKVRSRYATAGLALGLTFRPAPSTKIIPNGALRFEHAAADVTDPVFGKETFTDNAGVVDLGMGLIFFRDRLAIQPTVQIPFAADDNSVSYGLSLSVGIGVRR